LPQAKIKYELKAQEDFYISELDAEKLGLCAMKLGAGRAKKEDKIDLAVGMVINKKVGDYVSSGESVVTIHGNDERLVEEVLPEIKSAVKTSKQKVAKGKLIHAVVQRGLAQFL